MASDDGRAFAHAQAEVELPPINGRARASATAQRAQEVLPALGKNLRRLRMRRGLSLERLSKQSRVSRAMLSQIELGHSAPTIHVLIRIVSALRVSFGALLDIAETPKTYVLPSHRAKLLSSPDGAMQTRALFPWDLPRRSELYQVELKPKTIEHATAHAPGTTENLVVSQGSVVIHVADETAQLRDGDALFFHADVPHAYENVGDQPAILYLSVTYPHEVNG